MASKLAAVFLGAELVDVEDHAAGIGDGFAGQHELGEDAELADDDVVGRGIDKEGEDAADVASGAVIALQNGHAVGVLDLVVDALAEGGEFGDASVDGGERLIEGGGECARVDERVLGLVGLDGIVGGATGGLLLLSFGAAGFVGAAPSGLEGVPVAGFRIDALVEVSEFPDRLSEHSEGTEFEHFVMGSLDDE